MVQTRQLKSIGITLGSWLALTCACSPNQSESRSGEEISLAYGHREQALASHSNLTHAEQDLYRSDVSYIHQLANPDIPIRLNMADPRQYRFAITRLKLAGKTPKNSPYLFELIEKRRQEHISRGYKAGLLPNAQYTDQVHLTGVSSGDRSEQHYIETASLGETTSAQNDGFAAAGSTFPGVAYYTYTDINCTDISGYPIGDLGWAEEYDNGHNANISTTCNPGLSNLKRYIFSSYKVEDSQSGFHDSYVFTEIGATNAINNLEAPRLSVPIVNAPVDLKFNDNIISVCLNRTWTQDCDYDLTGTPQAIKLPLKGSVSVLSSHFINLNRIQQIRNELQNGNTPPDAGQILLVLTSQGGGCKPIDVNNPLRASMLDFWNRVTVSPDLKTFSWDQVGQNAAFFTDGCRQAQNFVKLTMRISLPLIDQATGTAFSSSITLSNDENVARPDFPFKPITMTNSCLAEGTLIQLANGESSPIESLEAGMQVFNPHVESRSLQITDTAKGFEMVPMVRIRDEAGRSLLMTEMHPIQTADRGLVQARWLRLGDVVMTQSGASKLVEVSREPYGGKVYNLKVGSDAEMASLGGDQTVVYANGFMVGDGRIQAKYESIAMAQKEGDILARLPKHWHRDYLLSQQKQ